MVKFAQQFEQQKIPEWHQAYINYNFLMKKIEDFNNLQKSNNAVQLPGLYYFSAQLKKTVCLNFKVQVDKKRKAMLKQTRSTNADVADTEPQVTSTAALNASDSEEEEGQADPQFGVVHECLQIEELDLKVRAHVLQQELDKEDQEVFEKVQDHLRRLYPANMEDEDADVDEKEDMQQTLTKQQDLKELFKQEMKEVLAHIAMRCKRMTVRLQEKGLFQQMSIRKPDMPMAYAPIISELLHDSVHNVEWNKELIVDLQNSETKYKNKHGKKSDTKEPLLDNQQYLKQVSEKHLQEFLVLMIEQVILAEEFYQKKLNGIINEFVKLQAQNIDMYQKELNQDNHSTGFKYTHPITQQKFEFENIDEGEQHEAFMFQQLRNHFSTKHDSTFQIDITKKDNKKSSIQEFMSDKGVYSFKKSDMNIIKKGETDSAQSKFRPWIKIYQELKWLNQFAITNDVALQNLMKSFSNSFLIENKSNLLTENLRTIYKQTEMMRNEYIEQMYKDIKKVVGLIFFDGDEKKALNVLDKEKEISPQQLMTLSLFSGASIAQLVMMLIFFTLIGQNVESMRSKWFIDEFFQLEPFFRLVFSMLYMTFAAGLLVKIWARLGINYIHIMQVDYENRMNPYQLWKITAALASFFLLIQFTSVVEIAAIYDDETKENWNRDQENPITEAGRVKLTYYKSVLGFLAFTLIFFLWFNPFRFLHRRLRNGVNIAQIHLMLAPFGNVSFKTYLWGEIMTDCIIQLEDIGKMVACFVSWDFSNKMLSAKQAYQIQENHPTMVLKWWLYLVSFLPYWWRMCQNLKKWFWLNHPEQKWNVLKYCWLITGSVCLIVYCETHKKGFYYAYYIFKAIGSLHKVYWDFFVDWGLFSGSKYKILREEDKMKFKPWVYYVCMILDLFGLFFWLIVFFIYKKVTPHGTYFDAAQSLEFYNNIMWITWMEMLVNGFRRTIWVLIRVENEFFNNLENFRDIITIPPIKSET